MVTVTVDKTPIEKLKTKSWIAIVIMFFVLLAVGMATYSWYIVSTAPTVRAVETYMSVVDPILSIARATTEDEAPPEVSNNDAAIGDSTWGAKVSSFQDHSIVLDLPATVDTDGRLKAVSYAADGRLDTLIPLDEKAMGQDTEGHRLAGVRYYTDEEGHPCAVGLGVWVRINKEDKDLVVKAADIKVKNAAGDTVVDSDKVGVGIRTLAVGADAEGHAIKLPDERRQLTHLSYDEESGTHNATIFDHAAGNPFPINTPVLLEIVIYLEGDTKNHNGLIAANVSETLYANIQSVTFYDNISFNPNR